ncbi:MAG: rod shape-determining protein MreC [Chloroflexi bacterium]|nr:rod shape-determining protein MreC [Chloroflexota bacterium]
MKTSRSSSAWLLVLLLVVGGAVLLLSSGGRLQPAESLLLRLLAPVQGTISSLVGGSGALLQDLRDLRDLQERYKALEEQATALLIENIQLKEVQAENEDLRRLLNFAQANTDLELRATSVRARVLGQEPTNLSRYLLVDVGAEQGVRRNMPVATEAGLVGTVDEVYATVSKVRLIHDLDSTVNVILQRSRTAAVARGQVDGSLLVEWIPQGPDVVAVGDLVLTSGLGGRFPRLLVVGQVVETWQRDYETFQSAVVRPAVDFDHLQSVLVVAGFVPLEEGLEAVFSPPTGGEQAETPGMVEP